MRNDHRVTAGLWYVVVVSVGVGIAMPAWWVVALTRGLVPEVAEGRRDIWFHIGAEMLTGVMLIAGGIATAVSPEAGWSGMLSTFGWGLLVYTLIQSPGYYVDRGERQMVAMFGMIWLFVVPAIVVRFL